MKKIFLTSGLVLCMACPAVAGTPTGGSATTDIASDSNGAGLCVVETLGTAQDGASTAFQAKWTAHTHSITYVHGTAGARDTGFSGNATSINQANVAYDTANITAANNPFSIDGYTFDHWQANYNASSGQQVNTDYGPGDLLGNSTDGNKYKVDADLELTAIWTADNYKITYKPGLHGSGTDAEYTGATNGGLTYDSTWSTKSFADTGLSQNTGYTFSKWNTAADGTGDNYEASAQQSAWTSTEGLSLYAIYTANQTVITYSCGAGIAGSSSTGSFIANSALANATNHQVTVSYDQSYSLPAVGSNCEMQGYTPTGWSCKVGETELSNNGFGTGADVGKWKTDERAVTCTATWSQNTIGTTFTGNGGQVSGGANNCKYDGNISLPTATRTGYDFAGWEAVTVTAAQ